MSDREWQEVRDIAPVSSFFGPVVLIFTYEACLAHKYREMDWTQPGNGWRTDKNDSDHHCYLADSLGNAACNQQTVW